ncbi:MAG: FtsX-like permease family protein [Phycisphaerales bacterium]|nr:FtsX-like permease family protein [Phycisphaerales bacterium]MCB9836946.1 FtsX-like permease family protein [Phycisphaera sp.]
MQARRRRTALLVAAVALSALLIAAVSTAMVSIQGSLTERIASTIGRSDVILKAGGSGQTIDESWIERAESWPGVAQVAGRVESTLALRASVELYRPEYKDSATYRLIRTQTLVSAMGNGFDVAQLDQIRPIPVVKGRLPRAEDEIAIDTLLAERLAGRVGESGALGGAIAMRDVLLNQNQPLDAEAKDKGEAERFNERVTVGVGDSIEQVTGLFRRSNAVLKVVGIVEPPPLGGRPQAYMTRQGLAAITNQTGRVSAVEILLADGVDAESFAAARKAELSESDRVIIQTTAKITSGLSKNIRSSRIGMILASAISFLSASFIIMTGLTVDVAERQRELAVLRCIGGKRNQLAASQLISGLVIGGLGALLGTPTGIALCGVLMYILRDQLRAGLVVSWWPAVLAGTGAIVAGLIGALWPAWKAASTSPLRALSPRASATRRRSVVLVGIIGLIGIAVQTLTVTIPSDGDVAFYSYILIGLPAMFVGYFLVGVPGVLIVARLFGPAISKLLALPPMMLRRTIEQTPYRFGFTAGAMMGGLALMISIWTQGGSVMRDWLGNLKFPDAFVSGLALSPEAQDKLDALPFVTGTCAITLHPVETDAFGVKGLTTYKSSFIAFEPEVFFELAELKFVEGDEETAKARLIEGGAILVAREFQVAQGLGVGDTFVCRDQGKEFPFEIVGVVTSPGLDIVSKFFNIGEEYAQQAIHAVFGSRRDMIEKFGNESINLIQIELRKDFDDAEAIEVIRRELFPFGIMDAGSGRAIKEQLRYVLGGAIGASSIVGLCAMIVACFGVANLIAAGIEARRFELGVLRSIGAQKSVLLRMVIGEALIIAAVACVLGSLMGFQGAWAGREMNRMIIGLEMKPYFPRFGVMLGWILVTIITIAAALPAGYLVMRTSPRALLQAKG